MNLNSESGEMQAGSAGCHSKSETNILDVPQYTWI